jgi:hypothetical protein
MLESLGCTIKYEIEKTREIWVHKGCEIVFDTYPGLPTYIEVECHNEKQLKNTMKEVGLTEKMSSKNAASNMYKDLYGIPKLEERVKSDTDNLGLTFEHAKKKLNKSITKNKPDFERRLKEQIQYLKKTKQMK